MSTINHKEYEGGGLQSRTQHGVRIATLLRQLPADAVASALLLHISPEVLDQALAAVSVLHYRSRQQARAAAEGENRVHEELLTTVADAQTTCVPAAHDVSGGASVNTRAQAPSGGRSLKQLWESELRNTSIGNEGNLGELLELVPLGPRRTSFKLVSKDDSSMIKLPVTGGKTDHGPHLRTAYVYLDGNCIVTPWERSSPHPELTAWIKFNKEIIENSPKRKEWKRIVEPSRSRRRHPQVSLGGYTGWILLRQLDLEENPPDYHFGCYKYTLGREKLKGKGRWLFEHRPGNERRTIEVIKDICKALKDLII